MSVEQEIRENAENRTILLQQKNAIYIQNQDLQNNISRLSTALTELEREENALINSICIMKTALTEGNGWQGQRFDVFYGYLNDQTEKGTIMYRNDVNSVKTQLQNKIDAFYLQIKTNQNTEIRLSSRIQDLETQYRELLLQL